MPKGARLLAGARTAIEVHRGRPAHIQKRGNFLRPRHWNLGASVASDPGKQPQVSLRRYARISSADNDRAVIFKKGKWRVATRKDKIANQVGTRFGRDKSKDIYDKSASKFLEFFNSAAGTSAPVENKRHRVAAALNSGKLTVDLFKDVFDGEEIEAFVKTGLHEVSPARIDEAMHERYGDLVAGKEPCAGNVRFEKAADFFKQFLTLKAPASGGFEPGSNHVFTEFRAGWFEPGSKEVHVFTNFLAYNTLVHEAHHAYSARHFLRVFGTAIDEGVTEYLARSFYRDEIQPKLDAADDGQSHGPKSRLKEKFHELTNGYNSEVSVVREVARQLPDGENLIKEAYFTGYEGVEKLNKALKDKYGSKEYLRFCCLVKTKPENPVLTEKNYREAMKILRSKDSAAAND